MALQIQKILNKGLIAGLVVGALSFFLNIVPCTTSPVSAETEYSWSLCKIPNPFVEQAVELGQGFYGSFANSTAGLVIQFGIAFAIFTVLFTFLHRRKNKKILDLTG